MNKQSSLRGTLTNLSSSAPPTGAGRPHSPQVFPSWSCESQHQAYSHHFRRLPPSCPRARLPLTRNALLTDKSAFPVTRQQALSMTLHRELNLSQVRGAGLDEPTCKDTLSTLWVTHPFRDSGTVQARTTRVSGRYGHKLNMHSAAPGSRQRRLTCMPQTLTPSVADVLCSHFRICRAAFSADASSPCCRVPIFRSSTQGYLK